jgi:hypothetical protein
MTLTDLSLLLEQARLSADAMAIASGHRAANEEGHAASLRDTLNRVGLWRGLDDAALVASYARGAMTLRDLASHFADRK